MGSTITLEKAITEYLKLSSPEFCNNNPEFPLIFSSSAVALASRLAVWKGIKYLPGVFYIAVVGPVRSGKTDFVRTFLRTFGDCEIREIPTGSPQSMLYSIKEMQHGYVWYDEVKDLALKLDSYMGTLPHILNMAYYLDSLSHTRTKKEASIYIPAGSYFIHAYFTGTTSDWALIERKLGGTGFLRRTLVLHTKGIIPFYVDEGPGSGYERKRARMLALAKKGLRALSKLEVTVKITGMKSFESRLMREPISLEKMSMIEEYHYKMLAARLLANLTTLDLIDAGKEELSETTIWYRIKENARKYGIPFEGNPGTDLVLTYDVSKPLTEDTADVIKNSGELSIDLFIPPNFALSTYNLLMQSIKKLPSAPDEESIQKTLNNIREWLTAGKEPVVSMRTFLRELLSPKNPQSVESMISYLEAMGAVNVGKWVYRGRESVYVILDTKRRICGNCVHYLADCPRIVNLVDYKERISAVDPRSEACDMFEYKRIELEEIPKKEVEKSGET